jgi:hypothetical protein
MPSLKRNRERPDVFDQRLVSGASVGIVDFVDACRLFKFLYLFKQLHTGTLT